MQVSTLALALACASAAFYPQGQKPIEVHEPTSLRRAPPDTLSQMLSVVDLMAQIRILEAKRFERQVPGGHLRMTRLSGVIIEKGRSRRRSVRPGGRILILQQGGGAEEPANLQSVTGYGTAPLTPGKSYLLALDWSEEEQSYYLAFDADSVFEIEDGRVRPRGNGSAARQLAGQDLREAILRIK